MKKIFASVIFHFFCFIPLQAAATEFEVLSYENQLEGKPVNVSYRINDFYSIYYLYMNVIRPLYVDKHLDDSQVKSVISKMIRGLQKNGLVQLTIDDYQGGDLSVTLKTGVSKKDFQPILFLVSNYDMSTKRIIGRNGVTRAYATYFYLVGDKLVKYQIIKNAEEKLEKARKKTNSLANFYLLDEKKDNDSRGKKLLQLGIKTEDDALEKFLMHLTLSEYYLLEGDTREARNVLDKARDQADNASDAKIRQKLMGIYRYADDIYRYFVSYRG